MQSPHQLAEPADMNTGMLDLIEKKYPQLAAPETGRRNDGMGGITGYLDKYK